MSLPREWENKAKNKAEEILAEFYEDSSEKAPIPIRDVIESYVGDVHYVVSEEAIFKKGVSGFVKRDPLLGWLMAINGNDCRERQRFTSAHELGHIVLFKNPQVIEYCSRDGTGWVERVCDYFAGHLLMPEKFVRIYYHLYGPVPFIGDIARAFEVSRPAAEIQLKILDLPFRKTPGQADITF